MRGLHLDAGTLTYRDDLPEPTAGPGETTVEVLQAGVCATDLALQRGYMGFRGIPGHEFVGRAVDGPLAGRRVVGDINAACGRCAVCVAGDPHHCPHRTVLGILNHGGAFAERLVLPTRNLLAVPDSVSTDAATFVEPLAAAFEIGTQIELTPGQRAVVAGDGKLGLLCAWALFDAGVDVVVAGRHAARAGLLPPDVELRLGMLEDDGAAAEAGDLRPGRRGDRAGRGAAASCRSRSAPRHRGAEDDDGTADDAGPQPGGGGRDPVGGIPVRSLRCGPRGPGCRARGGGGIWSRGATRWPMEWRPLARRVSGAC